NDNYEIISHKSLASSHLYFNTKKPPFNDMRFRKSFSLFFQYTFMNNSFEMAYQRRLFTFIPPGILPREYYRRDPMKSTMEDINILKAYKSHITLVLREDYFTEDFFKNLHKIIKQKKFNWQIKRIGPTEFMK